MQIDVGPYTLRELCVMVRSQQSIAWDHTAAISAAIYNSRMGIKRAQMIDPGKLNPYRSKRKTGRRATIADFAKAWGK